MICRGNNQLFPGAFGIDKIFCTALFKNCLFFFITIRCKHTFSTGCMFSCNCVLRTSWFCSNPSNPHSPNLYPRKLEREQTDFLSCCRSDQWKNYKLTNEENLGCQFTIDFPQIINLSKLLTTETMNL